MGEAQALIPKRDDPRAKLTLTLRKLSIRQRQVIKFMVENQCSVWTAGKKLRMSMSTISAWNRKPDFKAARDALLDEAADQLGISAAYVLGKTKEVVERCMQAEPVLDQDGQPVGEYEFDSTGALKGLDMLGKHRRLWGDEQRFDRVPTIVLNVGVRGGDVTVQQAVVESDRIPVLPKVSRGA